MAIPEIHRYIQGAMPRNSFTAASIYCFATQGGWVLQCKRLNGHISLAPFPMGEFHKTWRMTNSWGHQGHRSLYQNSKCSKLNAPSDSDSNQRAWWEPQWQARPKQAEIWSTDTARYCQRWVAWMSWHKLPLQSVIFGATVWVVWVWVQSTHLLPRCSIVVAHLNILCRTSVASRGE